MKIINVLLAVLLFASQASAQSNVNDLVGVGFESNKATVLNESFNSKVQKDILPKTTAAIDLGSASKTFRNVYTSTVVAGTSVTA